MVPLLQDYARLHNFDVVATSAVADPSLDNMWNKVGWLLKVYQVRRRTHAAKSACTFPGTHPLAVPWEPWLQHKAPMHACFLLRACYKTLEP